MIPVEALERREVRNSVSVILNMEDPHRLAQGAANHRTWALCDNVKERQTYPWIRWRICCESPNREEVELFKNFASESGRAEKEDPLSW
jgi:hypothetical protein